jgi:hypothetical protein
MPGQIEGDDAEVLENRAVVEQARYCRLSAPAV